MKTIKILIVVLLAMVKVGYAQSNESKQLLLNVEKLSSLKNILTDMKKGYTIVRIGYNSVKNIAEGNFSLHEVFLDGLMKVSPEIKKYQRVADIIANQGTILKEYKRATKAFRSANIFQQGELEYLSKVYSNLVSASANNVDDLLLIITSSKLRMSDSERLKAIDDIFARSSEQLAFLRSFNSEASILFKQKQLEKLDTERLKAYYNLN